MKTILAVAFATLLSSALLAQSLDTLSKREAIFKDSFYSNPQLDWVSFAKTTLSLAAGNDSLTAVWQARVGVAFLQKQQNDAAIEYLDSAKAFFTETAIRRESILLAQICQNLGLAYFFKGDFESAKTEILEAIDILKDNETPPGKQALTSAYTVITTLLSRTGEHEMLVQLTQEAISFAKKHLGDTIALIGNFHQNLGVSYYYQGMYPEAEVKFKAAFVQYGLNEANRKNSKGERANILNNLGGMRFEMGDYEEAVNYCSRAIYFLDSLGFSPDAPECLNAYSNIAQAFQKLGELAKAEQYFLKIIEQLRLRPDALADVFAVAYDGLGQTYLSMGWPDSALAIHLKGLSLVRDRFRNSWHAAFMEFDIGKDYLALKQRDSARLYLNAAIETYRRAGGGKPILLSETDRILAEISIDQSRWGEALQLLDAASLALSDLADSTQADFESRSWEAIFLTKARLYLQKYKSPDRQPDDLEKAYSDMKLADQWLNRYRVNLSAYNPEILQNILEHTHLAEAILWEMYRANPSQAIADEMFETADRGKSRVLFEQFRFFNALESGKLPHDTLKNLNAEINIWNGRIAALADTTFVQKDLRIQYQTKLAELKHRREALLLWLDAQDSVFAKKRREPPGITRAEAQLLLAPDQCLLEYTVTDSLIYIFLLRKDRLLPPIAVQKDARFKVWRDTMLNVCRTPMSESVSKDSVQQRVAQFADAAHGLYGLLLDTLRPHLAKRVTVVRDGELNYLPFEALIEEPTGTYFDELPYLLHKFVFSYENGAALYREVRNRKINPTHRCALTLAPFADWSYADWGQLLKSGEPLPNLCQSKTKGCCDITYLGEKATKAVMMAEAQYYRFIHLFTHAKANDKAGEKSFILLRKPKSTGPDTTPDTLFAAEIFGLSFQAEIISLSACETSHGELKKGEGIICLTWAFTGVGARSLITTLWRAESDEAAPFVFKTFYGYLKKGVPRDVALCQAKADYLSQQSGYFRPHPFFWAPFILAGETGPVDFRN